MIVSSRSFSRLISTFAAAAILATTFVAITAAQAVSPIDLGTAARYTLLAGSTITTGAGARLSGAGTVSVGVSPGVLTQGMMDDLAVAGATTFNNDDAAASRAQSDVDSASRQIFSLPAAVSVSNLSGRTFTPGLFHSSAAWVVAADITLDGQGNSDSIFVFRTNAAMTTAASSRVILTNGAQAKNVYWATGAGFNAGASSYFSGHILAGGAATIGASAYIDGQILASRSVPITLGAGAVINFQAGSGKYDYTVFFDQTGTTGQQPPITGSNEFFVIPGTTITRTGYVFNGWNTQRDGMGDGYNPEQVVRLNDTAKLYLYPTWRLLSTPGSTATPTTSSAPSPSGSGSQLPLNGTTYGVTDGINTVRWLDSSLTTASSGIPYIDAVHAAVYTVAGSVPTSTCTYSIRDGILPVGLTLDSKSGIVVGTTFAWGIFKFNVVAGCTGSLEIIQPHEIMVTPGASTIKPLTILTPMAATPPMAIASVKGTCVVAPELPAGLTLDQSICSISGVPTKAQPVTSYQITAASTTHNSVSQVFIGVSAPSVKAVYFNSGSAKFSSSTVATLNRIVSSVRLAKAVNVRITGFADSMPGSGDASIAKKRSTAVRAYLKARLPGVNFVVSSNGSVNAKAAALNAKAQAINRRVEIRIN